MNRNVLAAAIHHCLRFIVFVSAIALLPAPAEDKEKTSKKGQTGEIGRKSMPLKGKKILQNSEPTRGLTTGSANNSEQSELDTQGRLLVGMDDGVWRSGKNDQNKVGVAAGDTNKVGRDAAAQTNATSSQSMQLKGQKILQNNKKVPGLTAPGTNSSDQGGQGNSSTARRTKVKDSHDR